MGFDLRAPIGLLFSLLGALLFGYGLFTAGSGMYARSLGLNVNVGWGAVLLVFGLGMSWLARRRRPDPPAPPADAAPDEGPPTSGPQWRRQ